MSYPYFSLSAAHVRFHPHQRAKSGFKKGQSLRLSLSARFSGTSPLNYCFGKILRCHKTENMGQTGYVDIWVLALFGILFQLFVGGNAIRLCWMLSPDSGIAQQWAAISDELVYQLALSWRCRRRNCWRGGTTSVPLAGRNFYVAAGDEQCVYCLYLAGKWAAKGVVYTAVARKPLLSWDRRNSGCPLLPDDGICFSSPVSAGVLSAKTSRGDT